MKPSDSELVRSSLAGSERAFQELVERYKGVAYAACYHHTRDFDAAADLAQEVFVQAYRKLPNLRQPQKFSGWLRRIVCNLCTDWLRAQRRRPCSLERLQDEGFEPAASGGQPGLSSVEQKCVDREQREQVLAMIESLPKKLREVTILRYFRGLTCQGIADFLGTSAINVKVRLHRAREKLKPVLEQAILQGDLGGHGLQRRTIDS